MSVRVMSWVMQHSSSRFGERLVLLAIADNATSDGGDAWPSIAEITQKAGMSTRAVYYAIDALQKLGELKVDKKLVNRRWRNCYTVVMSPAESAPHTPADSSPEDIAPLQNATATPAKSDTLPLQNPTATPAKSAGAIEEEPSLDPSKEPSKEPSSLALTRRDDPDVAVESTTAQTIVGEWIDRCRKRPPNNVIGQVSKHCKALLKEGVDADDLRRGIATWMSKGLHPSTIPSVVNEIQNAGGPSQRPSTTDQRVQAGLDLAAKYAAKGQ